MVKIPDPPIVTEDGTEIEPPPKGSPVEQLMILLEWARVRGFQVGPGVQIDADGSVTAQVRDLRAATERGPADDDPGVWRAHGHDDDDE